MKRNKKKQRPTDAPPATAPAKKPSTRTSLSPAHRKWFRFAAILAPFAFVLLLELFLRVIGYGYPTGFFLTGRTNGTDVLMENQRFTERFFPPALARTPQPLIIPARKATNTLRIFVFGESAAMGDPEPSYGFARILEALLRERFPARGYEVVNVAVTAINSHVVREIARDCAGRDGDLWIVYMGNNEVVGPYGAGTVFGKQAPSLAFIRAGIAFKSTRIGQLLDDLRRRLARRGAPATWEGMEMFLKQQVRQTAPAMEVVYNHFQKNLEDILRIGRDSGARLLVSTVVSNWKDCPPFASLHRSDLSDADKSAWERAYRDGTAFEGATNYSAALTNYDQAAAIDDAYAELHFRRGRCYWALGKFDEARKSFVRARDLDTLRFRVDSRLNEVIRTVATNEAAAVKFVDTLSALSGQSPHGVPGNEMLYEHVHFNFHGNYLVARTLAEAIASDWPELLGEERAGRFLAEAEAARRVAFTDYDRHRILDELYQRLQQPPFNQQLDHEERDRRIAALRDSLRPPQTTEPPPSDAAIYQGAIQDAPADWILRDNYARFLQTFAQPAAAEEQWRRVIDLIPHYSAACYNLANMLDAQGRSGDAVELFRQALKYRPRAVEARNGLGLALANQGKLDEAIKQYEQALEQKPQFIEARVNLGQVLVQKGKFEAARKEYDRALAANPTNTAVHINLGKLLSSEGKIAEAVEHYRVAVQSSPDNAVAHYNLANALGAQKDPAAMQHYERAVAINPGFAEARYNLGLLYAQQKRTGAALEQFREVVRLRPNCFYNNHPFWKLY